MSIPFVEDVTTPGAGIYRAAPGLARVVANNAGPFTYTGTGTYIVHDDASCVIIDPGPDDQAHIDNIRECIGDRHINAILITHTHRDHSPGALPLKASTGCPIWGCERAQHHAVAQAINLDESQDHSYAPDRVLADGEHLDFGFATMRVVATPGHLGNHLCFLWDDENALFSGDHIMGWATSVVIPPDGDMSDYMDSLEKIHAMDITTIWPTHGQPITQASTFITALIDHRRKRETSILEQIARGNGAIMDIVEALYQDTPKVLYPAAAQSVFAHIIDLCRRNIIETDHEIEIQAFFKPTKAQ